MQASNVAVQLSPFTSTSLAAQPVPLAPPTSPVVLLTTWRKGKLLVTARQSHLPDRCIKCNAPVGKRPIKRTIYWHHPAIFVTIPAGLLIYVILALVLRKRAVVQFAVCRAHRTRHAAHVGISWLMVLGGIGLVITAIAADLPALALAGVAMFFAGLVYAVVTVPYLKPTQIDNSFAWLKGCCPEYLATFPEWPYR